MNLIYACVFHQESYIHLLKILVNSIQFNGKIDATTTEIMIFTCPSFLQTIQNELQSIPLVFNYFVLDLITLMDAGCARLHIFKGDFIQNYDKILYLDTDIIINSDLNTIFNLDIDPDKLYVFEEGNIGDHLWGGPDFFDFSSGEFEESTPAFSSGILLFRNSEAIRELFDQTWNHVTSHLKSGNPIPVCLDQPFIVYNAMTQRKYDNQLLKPYIENNPSYVRYDKIIYHFPGGPGKFHNKYDKITDFLEKIRCFQEEVTAIFMTLTNAHYLPCTLNCIESLKDVGTNTIPHVYCIGMEGCLKLEKLNLSCSLIDDEENGKTPFHRFPEGTCTDIAIHKLRIIHENLLRYKYVCFTDGNIVYENAAFMDYVIDNIGDLDMLMQSAGDEIDDCYTGFMFIKSTPDTMRLFHPSVVNRHKRSTAWDDRNYINEIKHELKYKTLPLSLFPNSKYHSNHPGSIVSPYFMQLNCLEDNDDHFIQCRKWRDLVNICQYGTDGFGHQLEGILRLVSLSLNLKANYQYHLRKEYQFEHSNVDKPQLEQYLFRAFDILSKIDNSPEIVSPSSAVLFNTASFADVIQNDANHTNCVYLYDGVGTGAELPPNFEMPSEISKSLSALRRAFVEENPILPPPSYKSSLESGIKNVCCHIRLGDAVGTRILDNESLFSAIRVIQQKNEPLNVIVHSDGDVSHLRCDNTRIYGSDVNVLQVLSDFIHADILVMTYSSLSIAAHLLANSTQIVICPDTAGVTYYNRILSKCIRASEYVVANMDTRSTDLSHHSEMTSVRKRAKFAYKRSSLRSSKRKPARPILINYENGLNDT